MAVDATTIGEFTPVGVNIGGIDGCTVALTEAAIPTKHPRSTISITSYCRGVHHWRTSLIYSPASAWLSMAVFTLGGGTMSLISYLQHQHACSTAAGQSDEMPM